ncbi:Hypothetical_protein [Hexamita inflata]|uniref:Hypothetical_protein n=1 Tax=Hexamita inflata TaxID=28002 RepID=A0AA86PH66_9EUKA|nr:Hypothetical protein HINF_LOCUS25901 [Hexamita inflata]
MQQQVIIKSSYFNINKTLTIDFVHHSLIRNNKRVQKRTCDFIAQNCSFADLFVHGFKFFVNQLLNLSQFNGFQFMFVVQNQFANVQLELQREVSKCYVITRE